MRLGSRQLTWGTVYLAVALCAVAIAPYFVIIAPAVAHQYTGRMDKALAQAQADIKTVSSGRDLALFQDPDIPLTKRQALIAQTLGDIKKVERSLDKILAANTLQTLRGAGFVGAYHQAEVRHERAETVVRQSRQVLNNYAAVLIYVNNFTAPQQHLDTQLQYINSIQDFTALAGHGSNMASIATRLQADYSRLKALTAPAGFAQLQTDTLARLAHASAAFERLGNGLNWQSDTITYGAVSSLEQIAAQAETYGVDSLPEQAQKSPILLQLAELPEKIEHVEGI